MVVRVNATAVVAAVFAAVLAVVGHAERPAQVVVALAAGGAFLAARSKGPDATSSNWFTVRLLLAGNLIVFGVGNTQSLGAFLAAIIVLIGVLFAVVTTRSHMRLRRRHNRKR